MGLFQGLPPLFYRPDVFQKCAKKWISPHQTTLDEYGQYENTEGNGGCSNKPPPSTEDKVCKSFHDKIAKLGYKMF